MVWGYGYRIFRENRPCNQQATESNSEQDAHGCGRTRDTLAGHAGIQVLELRPERVHLRLENRRQVRNHIGGVHAAAMALLAESATGYIVGLSLPAGKTPVINR